MNKRAKLGTMLVEAGKLTEAQLEDALTRQRGSGLKLGQFLVNEGILSESVIVDVISRQKNLKRYVPEEYPVNMPLARLMSAEEARKYQAVPLEKRGNVLTIAMRDPLDIMAADSIEMITGAEVVPVICTEQDFNLLVGTLYGAYTDFEEIVDGISRKEHADHDGEIETLPGGGAGDMEVASLTDMAEEAPVIKFVNSLLSQAVGEGVSDVHLSPERDYLQVRFRVDGKLHEVPAPPKSMFLPIVSRLKILANLDISMSRVPQDGRFSIKVYQKEINVRVSTLPTLHGENVVLRLLDTSLGIFNLDDLGMGKEDQVLVRKIIEKPYGMILSTGPTGSGKSSSLFSLLRMIHKPDINIVTLEDPVEYRVEKIRQVQLNSRAGMTFASGLRSILRQDPDVIMVGEIRDSETASVAVQAGLTGHRVLSTLHTNDAASAITRFIDMGVEPFLVASVMVASIAQRLVRKICTHCKEPETPSASSLRFWGLENAKGAEFARGKGCHLCKGTGYKGRTGLFEVLMLDDGIREMILDRRSATEISRETRKAGRLHTLREDAARKVTAGTTTMEEAASAVML